MNGPPFTPPGQESQGKGGEHHGSRDHVGGDEEEEWGGHQGKSKANGPLNHGTDDDRTPCGEELSPRDVREHGGQGGKWHGDGDHYVVSGFGVFV